MELILLGTGNAMVTRCYNTCFVLRHENEYFLVDAGGGNGIFNQLDRAEISLNNIHHLFVTHAHTDHILGVVWVIRKVATLISKGKYDGILRIYGHDEVLETLMMICRLTLPQKIVKCIGDRILFCEMKDGEKVLAIGINLQCFDIASTKMKQFGFKAILPNGKHLVCLGDEPYNPKCRSYVENADWLLAEAFCLYRERDIFSPYEKHHSTALDAGKLAEELRVKNLVLYHTEDKNIENRKEKYAEEVVSVFSGKVFVPNDLEKIEL